MKIIFPLIALSFVGNAVLLGSILLRSPASPPTAVTAGTADSTPLVRGRGGDTANVDPKLWQSFAVEDFSAQAERLRSAGFPPPMVRAILAARIRDRFDAQRKALNPPLKSDDFWRSEESPDPKIRKALRELTAQENRLLAELLGPYANPVEALRARHQYAGLPPAKVDQLVLIKRDYEEMRSQITAEYRGALSPPSQGAKLALLEKEQRADIERILSPQELEEYDLRTSRTANNMRSRLTAFNPTESEFRTIFQAQRVFDEKYNSATARIGLLPFGDDRESLRQRSADQTQMNAQIKAALGPQRGAEFERSMDNNFQNISTVVDGLGLPPAVSIEVWALQKDIELRSRAIQTDRQLAPEARNDALAALSVEATAKLTSSLGQRGLDVYKSRGGQWLQNLVPPPASQMPGGGRSGRGGSGGGGGFGGGATTVSPRPGG